MAEEREKKRREKKEKAYENFYQATV